MFDFLTVTFMAKASLFGMLTALLYFAVCCIDSVKHNDSWED